MKCVRRIVYLRRFVYGVSCLLIIIIMLHGSTLQYYHT
jgi:hypothetical protein